MRGICRCGVACWGSLLLGLPGGAPAWAETEEPVPIERDFVVRVWRKEHGLPDDRVLSLLCDRNGFLWVGTRKGVSRFDGQRFLTWSRSNTGAFTSEECRALAEDQEGFIWLGTGDGVIRLSERPIHHACHQIASPGSPPLPPSRITYVAALLVTRGNEVLVAQGFSVFGLGRGVGWQQWPSPPPPEIPFDLAQTPDGAVWLGTSDQAYRYPELGERLEPTLPEPLNSGTTAVMALAVHRDEALYAIVGSYTNQCGRLFRWDSTGWQRVSDDLIRNDSSPPFLFADSAGELWYPREGVGLLRRKGPQRAAHEWPASLEGVIPICMAEDHEGNLWVGTERAGLVCLQPKRVRTLAPDDTDAGRNTWSLLQARDGALWVGTDAGVTRFAEDGVEGRLVAGESVEFENVRALAEDTDGRLWIGSRSGLRVKEKEGTGLGEIRFPGEWFHTKIRCLLAGRDGAIWVGTAVGLHRLQGDQTESWRITNGLPHDDVRVLLEDRDGALWLGTDGGGLARLTTDGFKRFGTSEGLSSQRVWALYQDEDGALWIGTDRGLNCLRKGTIHVLTTDEGLPDNLVNGIVGDTHGNLWIGHDLGIYRVARDQLLAVLDGSQARVRCVSYDQEDGLPAVETNGQISYPPVIALRSGRIAFATVSGVAMFDPEALPDLTNGPPARVDRLLAGGEQVFSGVLADAERSAGAPLHVSPRHRGVVQVNFTAPAFRTVDKVRFRYRLRGFSEEWVDAGMLREASYASLPAGDYTFEVEAANKHGYWSRVPSRLPLRVEAFWHDRTAVRAGMLAGAILLVGGIVRWRLGEVRRLHRLEKQAARAEERIRLARDLHDSLGSDLTELTLLSNVGESEPPPPDEIARRFNQLSRRTHEALHSLRDLIWMTHPRADTVEELASRLCEHAGRMTRTAGIKLRLEVPPSLPQAVIGPEVRRNLLLATNEAVHNAVWHGRPACLRLRVRVAGKNIFEVVVEDDGCGFDPATVPQDGRADRGLGLASMRDRLAAARGACLISSRVGSGTCITLRIPLAVA